MSNIIKCEKRIGQEYVTRHKVKDDIYNYEILKCDECPHIRTSGKCHQCYGQVVVTIKEEVVNKEIKEVETIYTNHYTRDDKGVIKEHYDADNYINKINILYDIPVFETNQKVTTPWTYADRPVNYTTACRICKQRCESKNEVPMCYNSKNNNFCNKQKPVIKYLY